MNDGLIIKGDCLSVMAGLPAASVDAIVTDPPYGLSFMGKDWDKGVPGENFWREALRVAKPGCHLLAAGGTRTYHRLACAIEDAGWEIRDSIIWMYGSGFPKSQNLKDDWNGWGTALKPAYEPFILARKPLDGTVANNVQRHGCGALNIDGCRVGTEPPFPRNSPKKIIRGGRFHAAADAETEMNHYNPTQGRWPANLIHDGSDEVVACFAGTEKHNRPGNRTTKTSNVRGSFHLSGLSGPFETTTYDDLGNNSRFFYCPKADPAEREEGLNGMEERISQVDLPQGGIQEGNTRGHMARNHHPTVKPVNLMAYLCKLITPPDGLILDPFCGSGSTGVAAIREGFNFIGIELNAEYAEIARRRIQHERNRTPLFSEVI